MKSQDNETEVNRKIRKKVIIIRGKDLIHIQLTGVPENKMAQCVSNCGL